MNRRELMSGITGGALGAAAGRIHHELVHDPRAEFHRWYYDHQYETWANTHWLGVAIQKMPFDLQNYQEILFETKPDVLIECGTAAGGSALFFASLFDLIGRGHVITIDIEARPGLPEHERISYLTGSSTAPEIVRQVRGLIAPGERVMAVLDSDHRAGHVARELERYAPLVTSGQYLVVEDTNINGHPVYPDFGPGPAEALGAWLAQGQPFEHDRAREKFGFTFFPGGWLRKVGER